MSEAYNIAEKVCFITPARFLFEAGKTPKSWNKQMLNDNHLKIVHYEPDSSKIFPNTNIMGGIAISYRDSSKEYEKISVFTSHPLLDSILKKVLKTETFAPITEIIQSQSKFNLRELYKSNPSYRMLIGSNGRERRLTTSVFDQLTNVFKETPSPGAVKIIGLINNIRTNRYILSDYIEHSEITYKYKVILPKSNGSPAILESTNTPLIGTPIVSDPGSGFTQSFIGFGPFNTNQEATSCMKYIKTKFARTMLGILKVTQDNNKDKWKYVPLQSFDSSSDIKWTSTIDHIDNQLFEKYSLSDCEIDFINTTIQSMY